MTLKEEEEEEEAARENKASETHGKREMKSGKKAHKIQKKERESGPSLPFSICEQDGGESEWEGSERI